MLEFFKVFILTTIIVTLWTAFLLLQDKRSHVLLNRWFSAFLFALTTPQLDLYCSLVVPGGISQISLLAATFLWLKGPFIWVFINVLTRNNASASKVWVHFVPWLVSLIVLFRFPHLSMAIMMLGMSHMLLYLLFAIRRLANKQGYIAEVWQGFQNSAYYWLLYIIGGLMLLVAIDFVVMSLVLSGVIATFNLLDFFVFPAFSVYVLSIGVLSVYRPELLFKVAKDDVDDVALPEAKNAESVCEPIVVNHPTENISDFKQRHLELDVGIAQTLIQHLERLMLEQHIYRQNELSLADLASALSVSVHQVSELLNVHCGMNFYEYINGYRLKYACNLLSDLGCQLRILDIAFEAGFNSKNAFYRAFKEGLDVTPNQYRSSALALKSPNVVCT